uniref:Uncharacterized protein n=1 Tax=Anopheles arabiensis TaxID=7173 RepID=A0A182I132_ANOAR
MPLNNPGKATNITTSR